MCFFFFPSFRIIVRLSSIYHLREIENFSFTSFFFLSLFVAESGIYVDIVAARKVKMPREKRMKKKPFNLAGIFVFSNNAKIAFGSYHRYKQTLSQYRRYFFPNKPISHKSTPATLSFELRCKITLPQKKGEKTGLKQKIVYFLAYILRYYPSFGNGYEGAERKKIVILNFQP